MHRMLPKDIAKLVPKTHLMSESEWQNLGVQESRGWKPEKRRACAFPYVLLLFSRLVVSDSS
uniref:Cyclin-dependent kinases regulatory subunit n=1 Tax=Podarcis muralis TaxID=64176 RepID=A0A670JLL2_PODMU